MKSTWIMAACALLMAGTADAAPPKHRPTHRHRVVHRRVVRHRTVSHASGAETSLVGIHLFDSGVRVVSLYGTPDDIQPVDVGGGAIGGGGGANRPGGAGPGGGAPGLATPGGGVHADYTVPPGRSDFNFADQSLSQFGAPPAPDMQRSAPVGAPAGAPGGGTAGRPGGGGGGPAAPGASGGMGGGGGSSERTQFTRWIYNRNGSKYGFVIDKFNRVIQIEAIGLSNGRVGTHAGIHFGDNFAKIMKTYGAPDGYEIAGNTIVVRYLSRKKVAFRLNRLAENKPHQVTGIVVAAGK